MRRNPRILKRTVLAGGLLLGLCMHPAARAADEPPGKVLYQSRCAPCHAPGPGHAGTMRLAEIRGAANASIDQRGDLTGDYIRAVVRRGLIEMPPWRQTELSDAELEQIIAYLTRHRS